MNQICRFEYVVHFTVETLTEADHCVLLKMLMEVFNKKGGFQYERTGELHAQGWGHLPVSEKTRVSTLGTRLNTEWKMFGWFKGIHLSPESNAGHKKGALGRYCTKKDSTYVSGPHEWNVIDDDEFKDEGTLLTKPLWECQRSLLEIMKTFNDDRAVLWICDRYSGMGKSHTMAVYDWEWTCKNDIRQRSLAMKVQDSDRMAYMFGKDVIKHKKWWPRVILIDIPFSTGFKKDQWASFYGFLEMVKAGQVSTDKYEGVNCTNHTYVTNIIITSNGRPMYDKMGRDRFIEYESIPDGNGKCWWNKITN